MNDFHARSERRSAIKKINAKYRHIFANDNKNIYDTYPLIGTQKQYVTIKNELSRLKESTNSVINSYKKKMLRAKKEDDIVEAIKLRTYITFLQRNYINNKKNIKTKHYLKLLHPAHRQYINSLSKLKKCVK